MPLETPRAFLDLEYHESAGKHLRDLRLTHVSEATVHAQQRAIVLWSLALLQAHRPDIQYFNELLVQYPADGRKRPNRVVPDNMVVLHAEPIKANMSFDLALQPVRPFWVLDYVACSGNRKDYEDGWDRYEHDLKVPYYLLFRPDVLEMTLYHHNESHYTRVPPNAAGRCALPELELEVALLDNWVRFWFRGELVPLPADLLQQVNEFRRLWQAEKRRAEEEKGRAEEAIKRAVAAEQELAFLRAQLNRKT